MPSVMPVQLYVKLAAMAIDQATSYQSFYSLWVGFSTSLLDCLAELSVALSTCIYVQLCCIAACYHFMCMSNGMAVHHINVSSWRWLMRVLNSLAASIFYVCICCNVWMLCVWDAFLHYVCRMALRCCIYMNLYEIAACFSFNCRQCPQHVADVKAELVHCTLITGIIQEAVAQWAPCRLWGCKNRLAPFPGRMSYKATKPGLLLFYILAYFNCSVAY